MNSDDTNYIVFMLRIKSKTANGKVKQKLPQKSSTNSLTKWDF